MQRPRQVHAKKLLVASIGVAAVSYVACNNNTAHSPPGNLMAPAADAGPPTSGNLVAPTVTPEGPPPPPTTSATGIATGTAPPLTTGSGRPPPTSGNLVPPPSDADGGRGSR